MSSSDNNNRRKKRRDEELKKRLKYMSKEEMAVAISKKKECNARALTIVQQSIEPNVEQVWLLENLKHINQSHFQDIVEERAITKFCGYPLCDEELTNVPKKLYKISTKENKVYDITDRKNYCSNICYKAGTFLKDQLSTSPLWLRDLERPVDYKILSGIKECEGTGAGAEVDLGNTSPVQPDRPLDNTTSSSYIDDETEFDDNLKHKSPHGDSGHVPGINEDEYNLPSTSGKCGPQLLDLQLDSSDNILSSSKDDVVDIIFQNADSTHSSLSSGHKQIDESIFNTISSSEITSACDNDGIDVLVNASLETAPHENDSSSVDFAMPILEKQVFNEECDVSSTTAEWNNTGAKPLPVLIDSEKESVSDSSIAQPHSYESNTCAVDDIISPCSSTSDKVQADNSTLDNNVKTEEMEMNVEHPTSSRSTNDQTYIKKTKQLRGKLKVKKQQEKTFAGVVHSIEKKVEDWFTIESMGYLLGDEKLSELLKMNGFQEAIPCKTENHLMYAKYQEIFKKLSVMELIDDDKEIPTKPVPDYDTLRKEAEELELKVKSFYRGDSKVTFALHNEREEDASKYDFDLAVVPNLPPVDQYAIMSTRRRIFIERLSKVLPDMLNALELSQFRLGWEIQELIATFNLGPTNTVLRPAEWTLVAIFLIKLLTLRNDILKFAFERDLTQRRLITYLMTYDLDGGYLDRLTSYLMDVERITTLVQIE